MPGLEVVSLVISLATLAGLIVSNLLFAQQAREMKKQTRKLESDLRYAAAESLRSTFEKVGRTFLAHPHLRPVFYEDEASSETKQILSTEDRLRAATIAEHVLDAFERAADFESESSVRYSLGYQTYFGDMMRNSDFLFGYLERRSTWWPDLHEAARRAWQKESSSGR
jgi:hypothetical protein